MDTRSVLCMCRIYLQVHWEDKVLDWSSLQDRFVMISGNVQIFRLLRILSKLGPDASERANLADPQPRANGTTIQFGLENRRWLVYKEIKPWQEFCEKFMVDIDTIQASSVPASDSMAGDMYFNGIWSAVLSAQIDAARKYFCSGAQEALERSWAILSKHQGLYKIRKKECRLPSLVSVGYTVSHFCSVSQSALQCRSVCSVSASIVGEGSA